MKRGNGLISSLKLFSKLISFFHNYLIQNLIIQCQTTKFSSETGITINIKPVMVNVNITEIENVAVLTKITTFYFL